ncbi:MAG TPA: T9SS type A sorting domain-containing protein [bacterium]
MRINGSIVLLIIIFFVSVSYVQAQGNLLKTYKSTLFPTTSFLGKHYFERIGYALCGAGDVNGDGFDDFLIGTTHNAVMGYDAGAVYLFLGQSRLSWGLNASVDSADARLLGQTAYDAAGYSVACNGDLNGDGIDDMIIGAPAGNDKAPWMSGRVYIVFGKKNADWGSFYKLFDSCDATYEGENNQDLAALSVAYVGDVNGDGYDDFLVGAPYRDEFAEDAGKAYFILGHPTPWVKFDQLAQADGSFFYASDNAETGYSVAGIGDINNDGVPDFAISAFGRSRVFVIYGKRSVNWGKNFDLESADLILYGTTRIANEGVGWRVAGAGDLNGDGISDVLISAINDIDGGFHAGKVYVLFGRNGGWPYQEIILNNECNASYLGELPNDQAGWGLAMAGDIDDNGFDDFLVGTYKDDNGPVDGKAYLIKGKATGWQRNVPFATIPDYCERAAEGIGYTCASAGDFDNDGIEDFLIAAPFNIEVQKWNGKVYLFASQQIPFKIAGPVSYIQSNKPIPGVILSADPAYMDTTDQQGNYQLSVRGKRDYTVHINKTKGANVGSSITSYDAALIARLAINLVTPDTINVRAADVNLDGKINMYDAANTLRYAVQLPSLQDSHAGEWVFSPEKMLYDSIISDYLDQSYEGFIRGDVDVDWKYHSAAPLKIDPSKNLSLSQVICHDENYVLPIEFTGDFSLLSFDLSISYDQNALEFTALNTTELAEGFQIVQNTTIKNKLLLGGFTTNPILAEGVLLNLVFTAKKSDIHQTKISVDRFQLNNKLGKTTEIELKFEQDVEFPTCFQLLSNYPNPFNASTAIPYYVDKQSKVKIEIFNILGEHIVTLIDQTVLPGKFLLHWDGKDSSGNPANSGVYICKASVSSEVQKIKITYLK